MRPLKDLLLRNTILFAFIEVRNMHKLDPGYNFQLGIQIRAFQISITWTCKNKSGNKYGRPCRKLYKNKHIICNASCNNPVRGYYKMQDTPQIDIKQFPKTMAQFFILEIVQFGQR